MNSFLLSNIQYFLLECEHATTFLAISRVTSNWGAQQRITLVSGTGPNGC